MGSEEHLGRLAQAILFVALLVVPAYSLITEDIDVIWTIPGDTSLDFFGSSLASGDVNGDGVLDIMVAADTAGDVEFFRGVVSVYYGNHVGDSAPDLVLRSPVTVGSNTPRLACGDLNGDGYSDIAVGEDCADRGGGICTVFMGGNPMDTTPDFIIRGLSCWWLNCHFGSDVSIGDLNGDGCEDLAVGAYYSAEQPGHDGTGRVYVFHGGPSFDTIPDVTLKGGHDGQYEGFGIRVSAEGDFDHNGFHDLYVGAWQYGTDAQGRMYVYYGSNPTDTSYDMAMSGEGVAHFFGFEKPGALNAQATFDYAVEGNELWPHGAYNPGANCGKVYVHQGGRPMDSIPDVELIGRMDSANLGYWAQSAGDVTGDGNDDLVGGAPYSWPPSATGAAYLWEAGNHFDTVPDAWMMGEAAGQLVGGTASTAGDLDAKGRSEFMVSNWPSDGRKYVWVCRYTGSGIQEEEAVGLWRDPALRVYPSPCREQVRVSCPLSKAQSGALRICDVNGRVVRTLTLGRGASGRAQQEVVWDLRDNAGRRVGQGIYVIELEQKSGNATSHCPAKVIVERQ